MIVILLFIFVFLGLSLQSSYAFHSGTNLSFENSVQLSGIYANSGIVTNNDTIHYSIGYGGSGYESYSGTYTVSIGSGGCLMNEVTGTNISFVKYYDEENNEMFFSNDYNCNYRSFVVELTGEATTGYYIGNSGSIITNRQKINNSTPVSRGINDNGYTNIVVDDFPEFSIYVITDQNDRIFVNSGGIFLDWAGELNNNNYGTYYKQYEGNWTELYIRENGTSRLINSGYNAFWSNKLNNTNKGAYKIDDTLYIRDGSESIIANSDSTIKQRTYSISESGSGAYYINNIENNEYELYINDGYQNRFVVGAQEAQRNGGLNNNNQASYMISSGSSYDLYVWSGEESIFISSGFNVWNAPLNNNGWGTYTKYIDGLGYLYLRNGNESILLYSGALDLQTHFILNNNNEFGYSDATLRDRQLYIWNGSESILIYSGNYFDRVSPLNDEGYGIFQSQDGINSPLHIWNGALSEEIYGGIQPLRNGQLNTNGEGIFIDIGNNITYKYSLTKKIAPIKITKTESIEKRNKIFIEVNSEEETYTYSIYSLNIEDEILYNENILGSGFTVNNSGYIDISDLNITDNSIFILPVLNNSGANIDINSIELLWEYKPYEMKYFDFDIIMDSEISNSELENFTITGNFTTELDTTVNNGEINYSHPIYHE